MSSHSVALAKRIRELTTFRQVMRVEAVNTMSDYAIGLHNGLDLALSLLQNVDAKPIRLNENKTEEKLNDE